MAPAKFVDGSKSVFAYENRYIEDDAQKVVLIDSKQSELNRAEAAIEQGCQYGDEAAVKIPRAVVTYQTENYRRIHRHGTLPPRLRRYFRAGYVDGKPITENDQYRALRNCTPADMSALLNTAPAALLFGAWDSTRKSNQVRLRSALVGEIIGVLADQDPGAEHRQARRGGARVDAVAASVKLGAKELNSLVDDQEAELSAKNVAARRKEVKTAKADARISASTLYWVASRPRSKKPVPLHAAVSFAPGF